MQKKLTKNPVLSQKTLITSLVILAGVITFSNNSYADGSCSSKSWVKGADYKKGDVISSGGHNYKIIQPHVAYSSSWTPESTPALWQDIGKCSSTNSGNTNSGNTNSGNTNSGNTNSGNTNSGNTNSGNTNSGNTNSGNTNSGNTNSGNTGSGNIDFGNVSSGKFRHPGILANKAQLDFVKQKIRAGEEPWRSAFNKMRNSQYGNASYRPSANYETVKCGSYSKPNIGCTEEREDALAAYTQSLMWYMTDDRRYAENAIFIMDQWAKKLKGGHELSNARLQTGWAGVGWAEAGEMILYTYNGWAPDKVTRFKQMLRTQYIPLLKRGALDIGNGNWNLIITQALISNAVFLEDQDLFYKAIEYWSAGVPAYMYLRTDGTQPFQAEGRRLSRGQMVSIWHGQNDFMDGLSQETCRDLSHTTWGIVSAVNIAEIALQQGVNIYATQAHRLRTSIEFHTKYLSGAGVPRNLCGGHLEMGNYSTWEVAYNHFHNRLGLEMPNTERYIKSRMRPTGHDAHYIAWETLTHAGVGNVGISTQNSALNNSKVKCDADKIGLTNQAGNKVKEYLNTYCK